MFQNCIQQEQKLYLLKIVDSDFSVENSPVWRLSIKISLKLPPSCTHVYRNQY